MTLDARATVSPDVMLQEVGGEGVLLDLRSESYFGLDGVGTRVWRLIEANGDLKLVHATLLLEYDVEPDRLANDLEELMGKLAEAGLVSLESARAQST